RPRPEKIVPAAKIQHRAPNPVTSAQSPFRAGLERREGSARVDCPCPALSSRKFQKTFNEVQSTCFQQESEPRTHAKRTLSRREAIFSMPSLTLLECDGSAASAAPHELVQHVFGSRVTADGGEDWEEESGRLGEG
ncbi:uncharacterized protein SCHCODRAFT_02718334, partial [Schizophyllum commune H4-8]|uniref:uncharacterized protein n=1 Tax=Schizophyllum commune (strain H4-8 / FGSC 9210) TaxID=578458 RepID=UPI00215F9713